LQDFAFLTRSSFAVLQSISKPLLTSDEMSDFNLPIHAQLTQSWDEIERLVDALQDHSRYSQSGNSRLVHQVKSLLTALQRLKDEISEIDGAFYAENPLVKQRLARLTKYSDIAGRIRECINHDDLKHDRYLDIDLLILTAEIQETLELRKKEAVSTSHLREKYQSEIDNLGMFSCCLKKSAWGANVNDRT
jgi:hypothetical protein